jgi:hypothetical protein
MISTDGKTSAIFIVGNSRSGTSMVSKILGNNPLIFGFNELHFFEQLWYPDKAIKETTREGGINLFCELISLQREGFFAERNPKQFYQEANKYFEINPKNSLAAPQVFMDFLLYESKLHNKKIPCEQTPRNLFFIDEISNLYPGSKIVCMMRDPRDVLLSQKYKWKRRFLGHRSVPLKEVIRTWFNYHPITISKLWNSCSKKILSSVNKENVHLVKFEELIEHPEIVIKELCNFLNVDFYKSMLLIPIIGSSIVNDQGGKLGIDKARAGNFLNGLTPTEIYLCQKITSRLRSNFGYKDADIRLNIFSVLASYISFPVKLFFALLLNIQRSKNLLNSIRRRFAFKNAN